MHPFQLLLSLLLLLLLLLLSGVRIDFLATISITFLESLNSGESVKDDDIHAAHELNTFTHSRIGSLRNARVEKYNFYSVN